MLHLPSGGGQMVVTAGVDPALMVWHVGEQGVENRQTISLGSRFVSDIRLHLLPGYPHVLICTGEDVLLASVAKEEYLRIWRISAPLDDSTIQVRPSLLPIPRTEASKQLRILQCNINGLCSTATKIKLEEIMEIAEKQKIQIIALQETKLNEKYNLKYKNYNILRKDRNKEGGGLAFLIKNLYYEDIAINIPNTSDLEAQGIKVYLSQNKTINIFNMYHPPNNKLIDDGTMAQFLTDNTIIVGDLNAKHQLWGCSMPNPRGKILSNLFDDNAFMCLNDGNPTHHSYSYNTAQALDISFSSPDIFHKCKWQILKSIGSDHLPILIEISTKTKTSSIKEKFRNFKKANWNLYQQNTNEDFRKAPTRIKDLEQNWISFKNTIIKAAKVSIPRGNIKKWIPNYTHQAKDIQTLITKRNELQKKCTQNQTNCRTELNIVNAKIKSTHNIFHEKINMKELDYALENTDLNKTPGPDGIHGQMISNLGKNGKERLLDIFNNSWKTGKLPQDWKTATIIPIKKLDKSADDPKNYRPISLTSICCKLMEKIILRRLTYHLDTKNLLPEEQYGFRKGHGTIDQLLFFTQKIKGMQFNFAGEWAAAPTADSIFRHDHGGVGTRPGDRGVATEDSSHILPFFNPDSTHILPFSNPDSAHILPFSNPDSSHILPFSNPDSSHILSFSNPDSSHILPFSNPDSAHILPFSNPDSSRILPFSNPDSSRILPFSNPDSSRILPFSNPDSSHILPFSNPDSSHILPFSNPDSTHILPFSNPDSSHILPFSNPDSAHILPFSNPDSSHYLIVYK
ncbi:hypothetical protein LAZ67_4000329 [Cordylochernes scorpioides]|uniref:Endonuclease/exonuclease/phosphatase domain-containing protein n=1 Tax=Cordylochernes scorpioides TaxID=51811 RepID=A0ABY6KB85_9ARAC|nr:hypothetical protein LAZ67_4000329 [Cordylochernes scorpioides]